IETFSPYARQFFDRMDKPQVDRIEGIPPAIAIEQRNTVKTTRSTVGTMTEICDYMKLLWHSWPSSFAAAVANPSARTRRTLFGKRYANRLIRPSYLASCS